MKRTSRQPEDDSVLTQESDDDFNLQDNEDSDAPSISPVLQTASAPRLQMYP